MLVTARLHSFDKSGVEYQWSAPFVADTSIISFIRKVEKGDKTTSIWLHQHSEQRPWIGSRYFKMGTGVLNKKSSSGFFGVLSDDDVVD